MSITILQAAAVVFFGVIATAMSLEWFEGRRRKQRRDWS